MHHDQPQQSAHKDKPIQENILEHMIAFYRKSKPPFNNSKNDNCLMRLKDSSLNNVNLIQQHEALKVFTIQTRNLLDNLKKQFNRISLTDNVSKQVNNL